MIKDQPPKDFQLPPAAQVLLVGALCTLGWLALIAAATLTAAGLRALGLLP